MKNDSNSLDGYFNDIPIKGESYLDAIHKVEANSPSGEKIKLGKNKPYRLIIKGVVRTDDRG